MLIALRSARRQPGRGTGSSADERGKASDLPCLSSLTGNPGLMLLLKSMIIIKCSET